MLDDILRLAISSNRGLQIPYPVQNDKMLGQIEKLTCPYKRKRHIHNRAVLYAMDELMVLQALEEGVDGVMVAG